MSEKRPRQRGDRKDGYRLRELDPMHAFMPYLLPGRTANEAVLHALVPLDEAAAYLERKNRENPEFRYSIFHIICAAMAKTLALRPAMNRFIRGHRLYEHKDITFAFVVKKKFSDDAPESLARITFVPEDDRPPLEFFREKLQKILYTVRSENKENDTDDIMGALAKLPRWLLRIIVRLLNWLDYHGWVPQALCEADPYHSSVFISNVGSLHMSASYHHLAEWGTNSFFILLGEMKKQLCTDETGQPALRQAAEMAFTIDERIADGMYFANSIKLFRTLLKHPELLELPILTNVSMEE